MALTPDGVWKIKHALGVGDNIWLEVIDDILFLRLGAEFTNISHNTKHNNIKGYVCSIVNFKYYIFYKDIF